MVPGGTNAGKDTSGGAKRQLRRKSYLRAVTCESEHSASVPTRAFDLLTAIAIALLSDRPTAIADRGNFDGQSKLPSYAPPGILARTRAGARPTC